MSGDKDPGHRLVELFFWSGTLWIVFCLSLIGAGGGHTGHAGVDSFKREGGKRWRDFLKTKLIKWEAMNTDWINNFEGPLLVISYTQLQNSLESQLKKILEFIEDTVGTLELSCALSCQEGVFKRIK